MISKLLEKNFHLILPFEMAFNFPHTEGYDPEKVIEEFWQRYDINDSRDYIVCLYLKALGKEVSDPVKDYSYDELKSYSLELMHLLVAYYLCHIHNVDLSELDVPNLSQGKITEEELKFRQINFALFGNKITAK
ncbi:hypothetical protein [Sphingobacterium yanglingense]|uniref:Uncharacterized protein n=1 Tax=Sphingobacterium yanglingense TaxID=1437280 RepID=A0A4R6WK01_9SPHI|nr:hypothetical protein [Sphingobacterium yanglingense]TDQ79088.1 hypothetical protein CLV99_0520 [Sphingobacterium yanglingense]